jgi:hypothetical protein
VRHEQSRLVATLRAPAHYVVTRPNTEPLPIQPVPSDGSAYSAGDGALKTNDTRSGRQLIFLIVLMSHVAIVVVVIREGRLVLIPKGTNEPLLLILLRGEAPAIQAETPPRATGARAHTPKHAPVRENAIATLPEPPQPTIDWQHEAELASENFLANAEKDKNYRDLAGLSPAQLNWIKQNRMKPAPPGIAWQNPRFEFDQQTGIPVFWINDHCVWVMLMIFCKIGKPVADGGLFNHMRDPKPP